MSEADRRDFLKLVGSGTFSAALAASIDRAVAIEAASKTGTIEDVEHIVILMQENRSFDHYYGTMRGVRGFEDPRAVKLSTGLDVWHQPDGTGYVLPFRPTADFGSKFIEDPAHGWTDGHLAWNEGQYDKWIPAKGPVAMTHYVRKDIPFHFALADAFTVCDNYYCSLMGPTDPNRYHMFTGWVGNDGKNGGPVVDNSEAGYDWSTFPERLQKAGISWKVYQDVGVGLTAEGYWGWTADPYIGNYGDNSLLYFHQYQNAADSSQLAKRARTGTNITAGGTLFDKLKADVANNRLPKVSYIVAPEAYSEHPNWIPAYGAWYIGQVLDILTADPDIWAKTVLIINYDENGGFFDHLVPPTAPATRDQGLSSVSTKNEIFPGSDNYAAGPYGMCARVPTLILSPWSKGGWVNSEIFDHTSVIQFIEKRFEKTHPEIKETNVTAWRRAIAGDLTSAFDFANPGKRPKLPSSDKYAPPDTSTKYDDYVPEVPETQKMPRQEPGLRHARALPYRLDATATIDLSADSVKLSFVNDSRRGAAAFFHVRTAKGVIAPRGYTVGAGAALSDSWNFGSDSSYDLSVYGPNGFFRAFRGALKATSTSLKVDTSIDHDTAVITFTIENTGTKAVTVKLTNGYTRAVISHLVSPGHHWSPKWDASDLSNWYDVIVTVEGDKSFRQQYAGHVETGADSISDPAIGWR